MIENDLPIQPKHFNVGCKVLTPDGLRFNAGNMSITLNGDTCSLSSPNESFAIVDKDELISIIDKIKEIDRPSALIPAQNSSTDKFPFQALPGEEKEGHLNADINNVATQPLGNEGIEQNAWQDFRDTGLPLLVNQMLHAFGWALTFFDDKGEGFDCIPKRVPYRGFGEQDMDENYSKIAQYLKDNSDQLLQETKV